MLFDVTGMFNELGAYGKFLLISTDKYELAKV